VKITRKQIRQIIQEHDSYAEYKKQYRGMLADDHEYGHPWSGTPEDLMFVQSRTWGHGGMTDPDGYSKMVSAAIGFTNGTTKKMFEQENKMILTRKQLRNIIREALIQEDKSGKGACPDSGCIKKGDGGWKIISNKTGKEWPQTYKTKGSAEDALEAYHARG